MATKVDPRRTTPEDHLAQYRATGDPQALGALFDATAPVLYRIALSLCPDTGTAEDALQETFLASLAHLDRHDPARPVTPWLVGILQNEIRMARRREGRRPDPQRMRVPLDPEGEAASGHSDEVRTAIESLEEPYRSVALLRWRYGLEPQEIAHVRDEAPGTTRSLLHRSLERLRGLLRGAPAFFLLPTATPGLEAIRSKILSEAATLVPPTASGAAPSAAAGGAPAVGLAPLVKAGIGVAAAVLVAGGVWLARRPGAPGDAGTSSPPARTAPAVPHDPPAPPAEPDPAGAAPAPAPRDVGPAGVDPAELSGTNPAPPTGAEPPTPAPGLRATPPASASVPPREGSTPPPLVPPDLPDPIEAAGRTAEGAMEDPAPAGGAGTPPGEPPATAGEGVAVALDRRVGEALKGGIAWLKRAQGSDGSWGRIKGNAGYDEKKPSAAAAAYEHPAGPTALALYALLKSGVPLEDPVIRKGLKYLKDKAPKSGSAYETSMMLLAVTATADPFKKTAESVAAGERVRLTGEHRGWAIRLRDDLLDKRKTSKTLGWRYQVRGSAPAPGGEEDLSSTQLAALALLAADRCGLPTQADVWNDLIEFALRQQEKDGPPHPRAVVVRPKSAAGATVETPREVTDRARGFAYILSDVLPPDEGRPTGGMTACGIGTLEIARYALSLRKDRMEADPAVVEQAIWDGLAWLDLHWSPYENPGKKSMNVYHLGYCYAVERAFDLLGFRRLGSRAWYPEMAQHVVGWQSKRGFWDSKTAHEPAAVLDTSFALLVLSRSTIICCGLDPNITPDDDAPAADERGK